MNGNGYSAHENVSVAFWSKEQRARVEALTLARRLRVHDTLDQNIQLSEYVIKGKT